MVELEPSFNKEIYKCRYEVELEFNATFFWQDTKTGFLNIGNELHKIELNTGRLMKKYVFDECRMLLYVKENYIVTAHKTTDNVFVHNILHEVEGSLKVFHELQLSSIASFMSITGDSFVIIHEGKLIANKPPDDSLSSELCNVHTVKKLKPACTWSQSSEDLEVKIPLPSGILKTDLIVEFGMDTLEVRTHGGQELFVEKLFSRIEPQECAWQMGDDGKSLEIHLSKYQECHNWGDLFYNPDINTYGGLVGNISEIDSRDLEILRTRISSLDQYTSNEVDNSPLYTPNAELEECDELDGQIVMLSQFVINPDSTLTQKLMAELSPGSHLFSVLDKCFCIRHSIDLLLYKTSATKPWDHTFTFHAGNMIQSSKTQKKFIVTTEDGSYVAIIDTKRNIYIYICDRSDAGRLLVVSLDEDDSEILGAVACPSKILLLTRNSFISIKFTL